MQTFLSSYIETALWSSYDESDESGGEPLDNNYSESDFAPDTLAMFAVDCERFLALAADHIADYDLAQVAHDFWLNRNGHGAGFWDGDYAEPHATFLDKLAKSFGECDLYVGDDGMLYC